MSRLVGLYVRINPFFVVAVKNVYYVVLKDKKNTKIRFSIPNVARGVEYRWIFF